MPWTCRIARVDEAETIKALQLRSLADVAGGFYSRLEIESYVREIGILDKSLIENGTYFVVDHQGRLLGCGGWSARPPRHSDLKAHQESAAPTSHLRSFFVEPRCARQGVGSAILHKVECAILHAGYRQAQVTATLAGVAFYRSHGYSKTNNCAIKLACGAVLFSICMSKQLAAT